MAYGSATAGLAYTVANGGGEVIRALPYRFAIADEGGAVTRALPCRFALHGEPRMKCLGGA